MTLFSCNVNIRSPSLRVFCNYSVGPPSRRPNAKVRRSGQPCIGSFRSWQEIRTVHLHATDIIIQKNRTISFSWKRHLGCRMDDRPGLDPQWISKDICGLCTIQANVDIYGSLWTLTDSMNTYELLWTFVDNNRRLPCIPITALKRWLPQG